MVDEERSPWAHDLSLLIKAEAMGRRKGSVAVDGGDVQLVGRRNCAAAWSSSKESMLSSSSIAVGNRSTRGLSGWLV